MPSSKYIKILLSVLLLLVIVFISIFITQKEAELPSKLTPELPPKLPTMTVKEKKSRFISLIVPAVNNVYADLLNRYKKIKKTIEENKSNDTIKQLKVEYKVTTDEELLIALKPHPKSIAIAQAAMESSWATSRFSREANNIFGVWSFDENEPRIAALQKRGNKTIWVKKYATIEESVYDYYRTLARSRAFSDFRNTKMKTSDPFKLVTKLDKYSEKGSVYGEELTSIIKFNKFDAYDKN